MNSKQKFEESNFTLETRKDSIVESIIKQFNERSILGQQKYGTTLEENNNDNYLQHLKEELMDAVLYIEKLQELNIKNIVSFGNYLLSNNRNSDSKFVTDADIENYKLNK